ncbi:MAG: hypothetical protein HY689_11925 [Chloroflexi bacterium]|nr:hypothetical protein [Chloroflexota bacterium]
MIERERRQEIVDRVAELMEIAESVLQQKMGPMDRDVVLNSRVFSAVVGNLITTDPIIYDLLEGEEAS